MSHNIKHRQKRHNAMYYIACLCTCRIKFGLWRLKSLGDIRIHLLTKLEADFKRLTFGSFLNCNYIYSFGCLLMDLIVIRLFHNMKEVKGSHIVWSNVKDKIR